MDIQEKEVKYLKNKTKTPVKPREIQAYHTETVANTENEGSERD